MSSVPSRPPYSVLARFYDRLVGKAPQMNRHARRRILGRMLSQARVVCDLGCGTGTTAIELARRGLKVYAVDLSPAMCRQTRDKARRARLPLRVLCADMRRFRLPEPVDLVLSEFNPLNHLPRQSDLGRAFRGVYRALRPGGWFYFDLNTCRTYKELYPATRFEEGPGFCLVIRGGFNARRRKGWLSFEWFVQEGRAWRRYRERMEDTCWSDAEVRRALRTAGFTRIRHWDGARVRPRFLHPKPGFDSYYLAQKPHT